MIEKITIDMLTADSVSVKKQNYVDVSGTQYAIDVPWRRAYVNSMSGRTNYKQKLQSLI